MNRCILPLCRLSFPYVKRRRAHAYQSAEVANSIADMWRSYKHMRQSRRYLNLKKRVFEAMRKFQHFRVLSRRVRQASLSFRKHRVHELIDRAANAARSVAKALRDQLEVQVTGLLASLPQYAYIKGKAIDECICRVVSFCSSVRCAIKAGVESVHARREGQAPSQCYGGIMVGIDLSRAFDTLDRPVLLRTLRFAQVSGPLQRILLEVHNQCKYRDRLGAYEDIFELQCGVRQGCSISPLRFSLFTCWFLNELSLRTSPEWVAKLVTWFADDQHLGWFVSSPGDLDFICRSLRTTFGLLKECGMCANPLKSIVTLGLRGSYARRWVKAHTVWSSGQKCVDFGVPGQPLPIPSGDTFPYLGTVLSFGAFEMQTCRHRIRAAQTQRSRLLRYLHSGQLTLRRRTTLYNACVRSSMFYGLHVVGVTEPVLQKLASTGAKFTRALACSPAHILHETTADLLKRLGLQTPLQALSALLTRRISKSRDEAAVAQMQTTLTLIQSSAVGMPVSAHGSTLQPIEPGRWFGWAILSFRSDPARSRPNLELVLS